MEPNKFEEHIRTQLEERELQPSAAAWSKLESQLGPEKSSNKTLWYAIAASLVAILVVGSFLMNQTSTPSNEIVSEDLQNTESSDVVEPKLSEVPTTETTIAVEDVTISEEKKQNTTLPETKRDIAVTKTPTAENSSEENNLQKTTKNTEVATVENTELKQESFIKKELEVDFIDAKIDEVVAKVKHMQGESTAISAEEIETLLVKAQREISNQRLLDQATTKIDPASLLEDVETELERSFRDKVFDALGEGFNKIRTAVVERNN